MHMADLQDMLDVVSDVEAAPVENNPTEEQVVKAATAEVLKEQQAAKDAKKAAKEAAAKEDAEEEQADDAEPEAEEKPAKEDAEEEEEADDAEPKEEEPAEEPVKEDDAKAKEEAAKEAKAKEDATKAKEEKERAAKKADVELADRMGKLAVRERRLLAEQDKIKSERETFTKEREEHAKIKQAAELLETNPLKAFKLLGKDFRKAADRAVQIVQNPNLAIEDELEAQRKYFDQKLAEDRKAREEETKRAREEQLTQAKEQDRLATQAWVEEQITKGGEKYELISARGIHKQLARDVWEHFEKTGEVVVLADFLASVEEDLEKNELPKLLSTNKAKKLIVPKATAAIVKARTEQAAEEADDKETPDEPHEKTVRRAKRTLANSASTRVAPSGKPAPTGDIWADAKAEALWQMAEDARKARGG
jgi:hypothetical protein